MGLRTYYREQKLKIDEELAAYRHEKMKEVEELALMCARDKGSYEHEYHSKMQELGIEIANLEAKRETLKNDVVTYKLWNEMKDGEIKRLNEIIKSLIDKIPTEITIHNHK